MSFPIKYLPLSGAVTCLLGLVFCAWKALLSSTNTTDLINNDDDASSLDVIMSLKSIFLVTGAYIFLLYTFLFQQSYVSMLEYRKVKKEYYNNTSTTKKYNTLTTTTNNNNNKGDIVPPTLAEVKYGIIKNDNVLAANRTVGNYMEQSLPFLISMYLHALLVNVNDATFYGWIWIVARCLYPFVFQRNFPAVFISTIPSYYCVFYMLITALQAL